MLIFEHSECFFPSPDPFLFVLQRTCELGDQYVSLEKETNNLLLDLEVEKRNTARTQAEAKTMGGKSQQPSVSFSLPTFL